MKNIKLSIFPSQYHYMQNKTPKKVSKRINKGEKFKKAYIAFYRKGTFNFLIRSSADFSNNIFCSLDSPEYGQRVCVGINIERLSLQTEET